MSSAALSQPVPRLSRKHGGNPQPPRAVAPLVAVLDQLAALLRDMSDGQYVTKPVGGVASSLGEQVRHCLDHVDAVLRGIECGAVDYDRRERGTPVETCRAAAQEALRRLRHQLSALPPHAAGWPLRLAVGRGGDAPSDEVQTSVGRELAFVLSHTIHHNALIGVMAGALGVSVPPFFGYAPSTLEHLQETGRCAQ